MNVANYIAEKLALYGVSDVFGIPGGVVLKLLYAFNENENIDIHLNFHEQAAAYAACGYAQASGKMGVAYATRGPGVTNMITPICEAYFDSLPVMFITAHAAEKNCDEMRIKDIQEMDLLSLVSGITKYSKRIDDVKEVKTALDKAIKCANEGRKGPVFLDFSVSVLKSEIQTDEKCEYEDENNITFNDEEIEKVKVCLEKSERPIILIGDGIRYCQNIDSINEFASKYGIPILSSRVSQDLFLASKMYYGYIGSHATRYSNFILEKADLIISIGNRMAFQKKSKSFGNLLSDKMIIRIDIDKYEFSREIENAINFCMDAESAIELLSGISIAKGCFFDWLNVCNEIREKLWSTDIEYPVNLLLEIFNQVNGDVVIVSDVGNNELWLSRACAFWNRKLKLLHSKSFKTVGCSLGKAIGAYYACKKNIYCFVGDQGLQFNIQELQYIAQNQLPITIVLFNNKSSGLMRTDEIKSQYDYLLHTTFDDGYSSPNFKAVFDSYGINCYEYTKEQKNQIDFHDNMPKLVELIIDNSVDVKQNLPNGNACYDFIPPLEEKLFQYLSEI